MAFHCPLYCPDQLGFGIHVIDMQDSGITGRLFQFYKMHHLPSMTDEKRLTATASVKQSSRQEHSSWSQNSSSTEP
jgi:hypothetical protein